MKLKPVMFVGTCSDAGKSIINTAFCRIFRQDGYSPAPFKAQNMSLNSYSTPEGCEIGRAQAVQAEACGLPPHTDMNPLLLKPTHNQSSQVVLNGKPVGNMTAKEYFTNSKTALLQEALNAFRRLTSRHNPIVLEGAGSISELNLRDKDITNMRMAREVQAATYLVADIDRGGVFASVYGSVALLPPEEKALLKGIIINKFRGDISLFEEGRKMLENLTGIPVVGVVPYFDDIHIEAEDSVALNKKNTQAVPGKINVAIVLLKCLSNFTDFDVLERDERFHLYYTDQPGEIAKADIIILPGSKNTIADMQGLRDSGVAEAIIQAYKTGKKVIGICGGYQMLGISIDDPEDYNVLLQRAIEHDEKVVYGSRFLNPSNKHSYLRFYIGGRLVTFVTNLLYRQHLTDEPTCYKFFDTRFLKSIPLTCQGFEFCPEVTAKVCKRGIKIHEVPIHYYPRSIAEGKKINWKDGLQAIWTLLKYRFKN